MLLKGDPNQAPPVVGVTDQNVNRPYRGAGAGAAQRRPGAERGHARLPRPAVQVPAPVRQQLLGAELLHLGKAIDLNSDNDGGVTLTNVYDPQYNRGPSDYDVKHTLSSSWIYELPLGTRPRAAAAGRRAASCTALGPAADDHPDAGRAVDRHRQPSEPHRRRRRRPTRRSISGSIRPPSRRRPTSPAPTVMRAAASCADRDSSTSTSRSSSRRSSGALDTEFRVEAFNLLNHPQFGNPNAHVRQRRVRADHGDAGQPVLRAVRHDGAERPARIQGAVLAGLAARALSARRGRRWTPRPLFGRQSRPAARSGGGVVLAHTNRMEGLAFSPAGLGWSMNEAQGRCSSAPFFVGDGLDGRPGVRGVR